MMSWVHILENRRSRQRTSGSHEDFERTLGVRMLFKRLRRSHSTGHSYRLSEKALFCLLVTVVVYQALVDLLSLCMYLQGRGGAAGLSKDPFPVASVTRRLAGGSEGAVSQLSVRCERLGGGVMSSGAPEAPPIPSSGESGDSSQTVAPGPGAGRPEVDADREQDSPLAGPAEVSSSPVGPPEEGSPRVGPPEDSPLVGPPEDSPRVGLREEYSSPVGPPEEGSPRIRSPEEDSPRIRSPEEDLPPVGPPPTYEAVLISGNSGAQYYRVAYSRLGSDSPPPPYTPGDLPLPPYTSQPPPHYDDTLYGTESPGASHWSTSGWEEFSLEEGLHRRSVVRIFLCLLRCAFLSTIPAIVLGVLLYAIAIIIINSSALNASTVRAAVPSVNTIISP